MKLITAETTLEEFTSEDNWLVKEPKTEMVYQMNVGQLYGVGHYLRVKQSLLSPHVMYVKRCGKQSVLLASKRKLLATMRSKQFYIG